MTKKRKKVLFCINTPAQAHTWYPIICQLMQKGHKVKVLAREYGSTPEILVNAGLHVHKFKPVNNHYVRIFEIVSHLQNGMMASRQFSPDLVVGFGVDAALLAPLLRKPAIIFTDSEGMPVQARLTKLFASAILTPGCFQGNFGRKHLYFAGYKELAYLHPDYFKPDPFIFNELKLPKDTPYVILRFNVFDAVHDINRRGFTVADQYRLVHELSKYANVFISPEGTLSRELEAYKLPIHYEKIHHALYYAQLLVTDTQTMTTEAAILGTPAIRSNNFVGPHDMGNFIELENKYDLIYSFPKSEQAIQKAIELIQRTDLKDQWAIKRQKLLNEKIDVTRFMVDFIDNYPESFLNLKQKEVIDENCFHNRNSSAVHKVRSAFKRTAKDT